MELYLGIGAVVLAGYAFMLRRTIGEQKKMIGMLEAQTVKLEFMITEYQSKVKRNEELLADYINNMHGKVEVPRVEGKELADATNDLLTGDLFDIERVARLSND
jgi:hypothetical protein